MVPPLRMKKRCRTSPTVRTLFARLAELKTGTSTKVCFTHPYTSCEKVSIEKPQWADPALYSKGKADFGLQ